MAKKGKYRTRVESVHEEGNGGWGSGWDQGEWSQSGNDQNGWQNTAAAHDNDVQPGDSISNASYVNTNTDWESAVPTPPAKDVPMHAATNGWGWAGAVPEQPAKSAMRTRGRNQDHYDAATARGMQSMLSAIAEQRQAQHKELSEQLQQQHQRAQDLAYAHQYQGQQNKPERGRHGRHRREGSANLGGGWGQTSDAEKSHSNHAAGETSWGGGWGTEGPTQQIGNNNGWAGTSKGTGTNAKSKKKRAKSDNSWAGVDQQTNAHANANNNGNGWGPAGGESSWGATGGWDAAPGAASTSVAPGGFGSTNAGLGGWGANTSETGAGEWGTNKADTQAPALAQSQSWRGWPETQQDTQGTASKGKTPKVTVTSPSSIGEETILSSKSQSGLSGFFARVFKGRGKGKEKEKEKENEKGIEKDIWAEETKWKGKKKKNGKEKHVQIHEQGKKGKTLKKQKFAEPEATAWPSPEEEEEYYDDGNDNAWGDTDKVGGWIADAGNGWGDPAPAIPSKEPDGWGNLLLTKSPNAYAIAADGRMPEARRSQSEIYDADHQFVESRGDALAPARRAFFSTDRLARNRIHWFFDPHKDPRVSSLLDWIQYMQSQLATFGFSKFLESGQRGALFANADYRLPSAPNEPVFDWLTFDKIQPSMDRTLQESLAFYEPSSQILVFVFLLSKSKSSMAIWRRKIPLPDNIRHTYGKQITQMMASLNRQYPIHVDEMPGAAPNNHNRTGSAKRKWLNWGRP